MTTLRERLLEAEAEILVEALRRCNGVQRRAAKELGITARSMYYRVRRMRGKPEHVPTGRPDTLALRFVVLRRDGFRCRYCGQSPPYVVLQVDHVVPASRGGRRELENLVTACTGCNHGKRDAEGLALGGDGEIVDSSLLLTAIPSPPSDYPTIPHT